MRDEIMKNITRWKIAKITLVHLATLIIGTSLLNHWVSNPISTFLLLRYGKTVQGELVYTNQEYESNESGDHASYYYTYTFVVDGEVIEGGGNGSGEIRDEYWVEDEPIPIQIEYVASWPKINRASGNDPQTYLRWFIANLLISGAVYLGLFYYVGKTWLESIGVDFSNIGMLTENP